jgi:hypothetical protein
LSVQIYLLLRQFPPVGNIFFLRTFLLPPAVFILWTFGKRSLPLRSYLSI